MNLYSMQVALLNGITMGGGAGISIPGTFRFATDKTVWDRYTYRIVLFLLIIVILLRVMSRISLS